MKTILYNAENNTIIGTYPDGYRVDGKPQVVEPPVYELVYTETEQPEYNRETHYLTMTHEIDLELKYYKQVWHIRELPPPTPLQPDIAEIIKLIIKKTIDGVELTEEELLILKNYNNETNKI